MIRLPFTRHNPRGILVCGGNATRFASAKGSTPPYPKHLESIAGKSLLERAIQSMVQHAGIHEITITLNEQMQNQYLEEISRIASRYKSIKFSYLISTPTESAGIPLSQLRRDLSGGAVDLNGKRVDYKEDTTLVIAHGDTFLTGNDNGALRQDIQLYSSKLSLHDSFAIGPDSGFVYLCTKLGALADRMEYSQELLANYGLGFFHINEPRDISNAEGTLTTLER